MKEVKCPHCGTTFEIDEAAYAAILEQVKNSEFDQAVERRVSELLDRQAAVQKAAQMQDQLKVQNEIAKKNQTISEKDAEIAKLRAQMAAAESLKKQEIALAVLQEQQKVSADLQKKETEISSLKSQAALDRKEAELNEKNIRDKFADEKKALEDQVAFYKDFKARKSTKEIGESLEQYCYKVYNQTLRPVMTSAYFDKDNDASEGSKGDFIFRDKDGETEYVSIMFEMKNEADETATKHRNSDFFKKLDDDRNKKGCEFAVLVSMLEMDNDMYNEGIVVVPGYEKMYVVRPENFIPIITLLVQTSKKALEFKKELEIARSQAYDVSMFEDKLNDFKVKFDGHAQHARDRFEDAIKAIDDAIKKLQAVRENLRKSDDYVRLAAGDVDGLTIKKLTWNNPTMNAKFKEARERKALESTPEEQ